MKLLKPLIAFCAAVITWLLAAALYALLAILLPFSWLAKLVANTASTCAHLNERLLDWCKN